LELKAAAEERGRGGGWNCCEAEAEESNPKLSRILDCSGGGGGGGGCCCCCCCCCCSAREAKLPLLLDVNDLRDEEGEGVDRDNRVSAPDCDMIISDMEGLLLSEDTESAEAEAEAAVISIEEEEKEERAWD